MARIRIDSTPNPNAIKITVPSPFCNGSKIVSDPAKTQSPLAKALLGIPGVVSLFFLNDFVTVSKTSDADWDALIPLVQDALGKHPHYV